MKKARMSDSAAMEALAEEPDSVCADASGEKQMRAIALPGGDKPANQHSGKAEAACPYAGLGMAALASGDLLLLAMAIAFALALGLAPERPMPRPRPRRLRPPLRGPPMLPTV